MTRSIPENFELIAGVAAISVLTHHLYMAIGVGKARKKYGVKYPDLYANKDNCEKEDSIKIFNCIQRGHQNSLEMHPAFLTLLVLAGLEHPVVAALAGMLYCSGRVLYFIGYSTGSPDKRQTGAPLFMVGLMTLLVICIKTAVGLGVSMLTAK